jgi:hypothetical protein
MPQTDKCSHPVIAERWDRPTQPRTFTYRCTICHSLVVSTAVSTLVPFDLMLNDKLERAFGENPWARIFKYEETEEEYQRQRAARLAAKRQEVRQTLRRFIERVPAESEEIEA